MLFHTLLLSCIVALQSTPAAPSAGKSSAKPAATPVLAPIAAVPAGESGPTLEVPADLAKLTSASTIAVIYLPDMQQADAVAKRIADIGGAATEMLGSSSMKLNSSINLMVKQSIRTDLEIPMNQPVLWWIDMPATSGDEPAMGMAEMTFHQAFRIPGALAAMEKARTDAAQSTDPKQKARPTMPIRARGRQGAVSVLANDLVVISSSMEPFEAPSADAIASPLLQRLPASVVCGRVDLSRVMSEQGDQLRMLGGFAAMSMIGDKGGDESKLSPADKRRLAIKRALGDGVGKQVDDAITALMQLKRASFALSLQGDDLQVWADWSRDAAFPAGLNEATVHALAAKLPQGMTGYIGMSTSAVDAIYGERFTIDDTLATLGDSPEQAQAWKSATASLRATWAMIQDGCVGAVAMQNQNANMVTAFRVKDAAAFKASFMDAAANYTKSGLATVKIDQRAETLTITLTPNTERIKELIQVFVQERDATQNQAQEAALERVGHAMVVTMKLNGNDVLISQSFGDKVADAASMVNTNAGDVRASLAANAWGTADWFLAFDVRGILSQVVTVTQAMNKDADAAVQAKALTAGKPVILRAWQGVQGGTARLTLQTNVAELQKLVSDVEAFAKKVGTSKGDKDDADDDDHDDDKGDDKGESNKKEDGKNEGT